MKARVQKDKEIVLYYAGGKEEKPAQLQAIFAGLSLPFQCVTQEELVFSLGASAGVSGFEKIKKEEVVVIEEDILLFCGVTQNKLETALREMRETSATVELKAVLTATNRTWSWNELYHELCKERTAMKKK